MSDRVPPHKNPDRVPLVLQAMDNPAAHDEPRHLLTEEGIMPRKTIEKSGIYKDANGNQFFMAAGDATNLDLEFSHARGEAPRTRKMDAAPENKARKASPENRAVKTAKKDEDE